MVSVQPEGRSQRLWRFHGGLHLPDRKALSSGRPLAVAPLPARLTLPLQQHIGQGAKPLVRVGERVLKGQLIGQPQGYISAAVHAPSSGVVTAIGDFPVPHPSGLSAPCIQIETDGEERWAETPEPLADWATADPRLLRERIRWAGIDPRRVRCPAGQVGLADTRADVETGVFACHGGQRHQAKRRKCRN